MSEFRVVKLTKRQLKMLPEELLIDLKVANLETKQAHPEKLFLSKEDYKKIERNVKAAFKKQFPYTSKNRLDTSAGMYLLNYGPNTTLSIAIKEGYALVKQ